MASFRVHFGSAYSGEPFEADDLRAAWCMALKGVCGQQTLDMALEAESVGAEFPPEIQLTLTGKSGKHRLMVLPADEPAPQPKQRRAA